MNGNLLDLNGIFMGYGWLWDFKKLISLTRLFGLW